MPYKTDQKMLRVDEPDLRIFQSWQNAVNTMLEARGQDPLSQADFFGLLIHQFRIDIDRWVGVS